MNPKSLLLGLPPALALMLGAASQAAESPMDALFACQKISRDADRLACLDREVAVLHGGTRSGDVIAVDRKQLEVDSYGLTRSTAPLPASPQPVNTQPVVTQPAIVRNKGGQIQGLEKIAVAGLDRTPYGQLIVKLQNGQLWVQTDRVQLADSRKMLEESTVSISNAALGSFQMQLNGEGPWFRVRRVN